MSEDRLKTRFLNKVAITKDGGCWEWTGHRNSYGYGHIAINGIVRIASRVAWELFRGKIPTLMCVLHKCDNPQCVNPDHLFLGSRKDNTVDAKFKGRLAKGERHGRAKLTEKAALEIKGCLGSYKSIAAKHNVSPCTVSQIKTGDRWGHLP